MRLRRRVAAAGVVAALSLIFGAAPASAIFTQNTIGCSGSATITDSDGNTYQGNADDVSVEVPREGVADWRGSISTVTHNHSGEVNLALGPVDIQLGKWGPSRNADDESSSSGTKEIPEALQYVLPGEYVVSGFHQGDEGRCAGYAVVAVDVAPFSTPTGIAVVTVFFAFMTAASAVAKAPKP